MLTLCKDLGPLFESLLAQISGKEPPITIKNPSIDTPFGTSIVEDSSSAIAVQTLIGQLDRAKKERDEALAVATNIASSLSKARLVNTNLEHQTSNLVEQMKEQQWIREAVLLEFANLESPAVTSEKHKMELIKLHEALQKEMANHEVTRTKFTELELSAAEHRTYKTELLELSGALKHSNLEITRLELVLSDTANLWWSLQSTRQNCSKSNQTMLRLTPTLRSLIHYLSSVRSSKQRKSS